MWGFVLEVWLGCDGVVLFDADSTEAWVIRVLSPRWKP